MIFGVFADIRYHICRQPLKIYTYDNSTHPLFNHPPSVHLRSDGERFDSTHRWALQLSVWLYMKDTIKCLSICHFITTATAPGTKEIVQAKMKIGLVTLYWMKILPLLLFQTCMTLTLLWNTQIIIWKVFVYSIKVGGVQNNTWSHWLSLHWQKKQTFKVSFLCIPQNN